MGGSALASLTSGNDPLTEAAPQNWRVLVLAVIDRLTPDFRLCAAFAVFAMVFYLLHMIEAKPELLKDAAFMGMAGLLVGSGGIGTVLAYAFGGTKSGSEVMTSQNKALTNPSPPTPAAPDPQK